MAKDPQKADAAAYNKLVGQAVLRNIRLIESRFDMKPEALQIDLGAWKRSLQGEMVDAYVDTERGDILGWLRFEAVFRHRRKRILAASAKYMVSYRVHGGCDTESAELFLERVGRVAAYPYFRAIVASLISQAGINMPPLPMMSLAPRSVSSARNLEINSLSDDVTGDSNE